MMTPGIDWDSFTGYEDENISFPPKNTIEVVAIRKEKYESMKYEIEILRAALEKVEWVNGNCPWCGFAESMGCHWNNCERQKGLNIE